MTPKPILLRFTDGYSFFEVTEDEYKQLAKEVEARCMCGENTLMDRIIAELLLNSNYQNGTKIVVK
jgi:hypothetical protein